MAVAAMMPTFASPFSVDTMLARCPQMEWKPDLGTMLFMNGDDSKRGTEEFRTLRSRLYHMREKMTLEEAAGDQRPAKRRQVVYLLESGTGDGAAARPPRPPHRRRPPRPAFAPDARHHGGSRTYPTTCRGKNDEFSIMQRGPMENLFFIPSGTGIEDPAELVGNGKLKLSAATSGAAIRLDYCRFSARYSGLRCQCARESLRWSSDGGALEFDPL